MAKERVGISLDQDLKDRLDKQAKLEGFTTTGLVAKIVSKYTKKRIKRNGKRNRKNSCSK